MEVFRNKERASQTVHNVEVSPEPTAAFAVAPMSARALDATDGGQHRGTGCQPHRAEVPGATWPLGHPAIGRSG